MGGFTVGKRKNWCFCNLLLKTISYRRRSEIQKYEIQIPVVGAVVGCVDGAELGEVVGAVLGSVVGIVVGVVDGAVVGAVVGSVVGKVEGAVEGAVVGAVDGTVLGAVLSAVDGAVVGAKHENQKMINQILKTLTISFIFGGGTFFSEKSFIDKKLESGIGVFNSD
jgi:outer membrane lipoprotein SlyB